MIRRFYESRLLELLTNFPVVAVIGPRQVGKSTLVTQELIANGRLYRTLDDITIRSVAEKDPKAFLDESQPLTIDEVQLIPSLLREIKLRVDRDRRPGRYLLTGSADLDHFADLSHVLAGRVGILHLPPICRSEETVTRRWHEWLSASDADELDAAFARVDSVPFDSRRLLTGGFPLSLRAQSDRERTLWMESFRMTYLERDLRRISDIFEVKSSRTVTAADAAPLEKWMTLHPRRGTAVVLYAGSEYQRLSRDVRAIPVSMLFG